ncbi:hypothetical protein ACLOJK_010871 [Asimina triloba]
MHQSITSFWPQTTEGLWHFSYTLVNDNDRLHKLDHKDWLAPNEVLKIFRRLKDPEVVITAFRKVSKRMDYRPNEALYSLVIEKLVNARKFDAIEDLLERMKSERCRVSEEFFYRLIKIYSNIAGNPEQAIKTLFQMPNFHCWPTVKTFNFVLNMLVDSKQFDVVHEIYLAASHLGITVDTCCFNILIKGLCQCGKLDAAFALLSELPKQGCKPNTKTYSTLMHCLCKHDRVSEAFELLESMERKGCYPDTITFNILISGLCKQRKVDYAMELLDKMRLKGCKPNSGSYQALLYGLLNCGDFVKAKDFFSQMLSEGMLPSFLSYKVLIEGLLQQYLLYCFLAAHVSVASLHIICSNNAFKQWPPDHDFSLPKSVPPAPPDSKILIALHLQSDKLAPAETIMGYGAS